MAKSLFDKIRKHKNIVLAIIVVLFILLIILGYALGPDRTWGPINPVQDTGSR